MRRSVFLLVVGLSLCIGCSKEDDTMKGILAFDPDTLEVRVRQKPGGSDCMVDYEAVNVRNATATAQADQIRWCVKSGVGTNYYIHFTSNGSPFSDNDFLVNKDVFPKKICSDFRSPSGKPAGTYDYEIHYNSAAGPVCSDPKVILR